LNLGRNFAPLSGPPSPRWPRIPSGGCCRALVGGCTEPRPLCRRGVLWTSTWLPAGPAALHTARTEEATTVLLEEVPWKRRACWTTTTSLVSTLCCRPGSRWIPATPLAATRTPTTTATIPKATSLISRRLWPQAHSEVAEAHRWRGPPLEAAAARLRWLLPNTSSSLASGLRRRRRGARLPHPALARHRCRCRK